MLSFSSPFTKTSCSASSRAGKVRHQGGLPSPPQTMPNSQAPTKMQINSSPVLYPVSAHLLDFNTTFSTELHFSFPQGSAPECPAVPQIPHILQGAYPSVALLPPSYPMDVRLHPHPCWRWGSGSAQLPSLSPNSPYFPKSMQMIMQPDSDISSTKIS